MSCPCTLYSTSILVFLIALVWLWRPFTDLSSVSLLHVTFSEDLHYESYRRLPPSGSTNCPKAEVTAILLNWSRFPNVVRIVTLLCGPELADIISNVTIWNNNPQGLDQSDFISTRCPPEKLTIYNSPSNRYFQARFQACSEAATPYCFIQDDDYLVLPEIIRSLYTRIVNSPEQGIHLLPPHEVLSSQLRRVCVGSRVHTSFAWLGHGAMIPRSRAIQFLALMRYINATEEEVKMADNYYTILSNTFPQVWFDQGIELGGGQPFTVGTEGDSRNKRHILRAAEMLDSIAVCEADACLQLPYFNARVGCQLPAISYAPCRGTSCVLETSINLLPGTMMHSAPAADRILQLESQNLEVMGWEEIRRYMIFPLSNAVDGRSDTVFCAHQGLRAGDSIRLDTLIDLTLSWTDIEMVWLVKPDLVFLLYFSIFESSLDGIEWHVAKGALSCMKTMVPSTNNDSSSAIEHLTECSILISGNGDDGARYFRARALQDLSKPWCVHEIWMRGRIRE